MSSALWSCCLIVAIIVGRCENTAERQEPDVISFYGDQATQLRGYSGQKCYRDIDCFSPTTGIITFIDLYPYSTDHIDTKFCLYTKHNVESFQTIDYLDKNTLTTTLFNPKVPTVFIVHGLGEDAFVGWVLGIKNELLKNNRDVNVITVDWGKGAPEKLYFQGIVNSELVSRQIARLLVLLKELRGYDIKKTHMIGFSLGAHLAGLTGKYLKLLGEEQMGRITGLDPAGPNFEDKDERVHLHRDDGEFVDVIHTSVGRNMFKGELGIIKPIGHADFYPNGGKNQPGCPPTSINCSHLRACVLFFESINSDCEFNSYACDGYDEFNSGQCSDHRRSRLGYHSDVMNTRGVFYLNTTAASPFCKKE